MTSFQLIITLSLYIVSMAVALILSLIRKKINPKQIRLLIIIHVILFSFFLLIALVFKSSKIPGYCFLVFFCSGIIFGGYLIRSQAALLIRIYFSMYIASILVFIYSPSFLVRIINLNINKVSTPDSFHLQENYYLEAEQMLMHVEDSDVRYKITRHYGVFHKTMVRNLNFGNRLDSITILSFNPPDSALLRGFYSKKSVNFEGDGIIDLPVKFELHVKEIIQNKN